MKCLFFIFNLGYFHSFAFNTFDVPNQIEKKIEIIDIQETELTFIRTIGRVAFIPDT